MRLDIEESSVDSIYITVWASPYLPLHMGKTENAQIMQEEHFGLQLQVLFCDSLLAHGFFILIISSLCNKNFILEIHVVYRIVPGCGNLAKIDFPLGHFRTQLAYRSFARALALIWYHPPPPSLSLSVRVVRGESILQMPSAQFWYLWYPGPIIGLSLR